MKHHPKKPLYLLFFCALIFSFFTGCSTLHQQTAEDRANIDAILKKEKKGNYYIGRRFFKNDYHFWGWVKSPQEPWKKAFLVMINEQEELIPDRKLKNLGCDNNYEYYLYGYFSTNKVYEPASDSFYPEFILKKALLINKKPPLIYPDERWTEPSMRFITPPEY